MTSSDVIRKGTTKQLVISVSFLNPAKGVTKNEGLMDSGPGEEK